MRELVSKLISEGVLKTPEIIQAFLDNDRKNFVLPKYLNQAYVDAPLPIGYGQTISQPYTVAFMMELLQAREGHRILDLGFGSGWTTAILAHIVTKSGRVYSLEVEYHIFEFGKNNLHKYPYQNIEIKNLSGDRGYEPGAPYDRILVSATAEEVPKALMDQLARGGRMVIPVGGQGEEQSIRLVEKNDFGITANIDYPGFVFVPFIKPG